MPFQLQLFLRMFIRLSITFLILYLIFTNFGTFLIILLVLFSLGYYFFYKLMQKIKSQQNQSGFKFSFDARDFQQGQQNFNFNDFNNFRNGHYTQPTSFSEINDAKEFFGFTSEPSRDEIKKVYKHLARKYHPDINGGDDTMMKKLNNYRDILMQAFGK